MDKLRFLCQSCGRKLNVPLKAAGHRVRCPDCGAVRRAPAASAQSHGEATAAMAAVPTRLVSTEESAEGRPAPEGAREVNFAGRDTCGTDEYRYDAFISYRHVEPDRHWAEWLHSALETWRTPRQLVQKRGIAPRLKRVFRDEEELPASADLSQEIDRALRESRFLIVVCSPATPTSEWVNKEVQLFRELDRNDRILALLIDGEPGEAFPKALREIRRTITDGRGWTREQRAEVEPLAADVRPTRQESPGYLKRMAKLRLLACVLGCRFDDLRQRESERRKRRVMLMSCVAAVLFFIVSGLTYGMIAKTGMVRTMVQALGLSVQQSKQHLQAAKEAKEKERQAEEKAKQAKAIAERERQKAASQAEEVKQAKEKEKEERENLAAREWAVAESQAQKNAPPQLTEVVPQWSARTQSEGSIVELSRRQILQGLRDYELSTLLTKSINPLGQKNPAKESASGPIADTARGPTRPRPGTSGRYENRGSPMIGPTQAMRPFLQSPDAATDIPERLSIGGELGAIRRFSEEAWVYLWVNPRANPMIAVGGRGNGVPWVGVRFTSPSMVDLMADYRVGEQVRVVAKRRDWGELRPPVLPGSAEARPSMPGPMSVPANLGEFRSFQVPGWGPSMPCWCFEGEGIEKTGAPGTWVDPKSGRAERVANKGQLDRSPGFVFRDLPNHRQTRGVITALYRGVERRASGIIIKLVVPDTIEGSIILAGDMGGEPRIEEFLDYVIGSVVEANVTVRGGLAGDDSIASILSPEESGLLQFAAGLGKGG